MGNSHGSDMDSREARAVKLSEMIRFFVSVCIQLERKKEVSKHTLEVSFEPQ